MKTKRISKRLAKVDQDYCVACGACVKECRFEAISIHEGVYAQINSDRCVGCNRCARICPASVIKVVAREGAAYV